MVPSFHWSDDGERDDDGTTVFPGVYCRHCGRSGWGVVLAPVGAELDSNTDAIRGRKLVGDERFRALIHAASEGEQAQTGLGRGRQPAVAQCFWAETFCRSARRRAASCARVACCRCSPTSGRTPAPFRRTTGAPLPAQGRHPVPRLGDRHDAVGLAVDDLRHRGLDTREKKALVFTDSVQDAAHRAGFVQSRSHSLTLRAVIREAIGDDPRSRLDQLVDRIIEGCGDDAHRRYRILPPDFADHDNFAPFWTSDTLAAVPAPVRAACVGACCSTCSSSSACSPESAGRWRSPAASPLRLTRPRPR